MPSAHYAISPQRPSTQRQRWHGGLVALRAASGLFSGSHNNHWKHLLTSHSQPDHQAGGIVVIGMALHWPKLFHPRHTDSASCHGARAWWPTGRLPSRAGSHYTQYYHGTNQPSSYVSCSNTMASTSIVLSLPHTCTTNTFRHFILYIYIKLKLKYSSEYC